MFTSKAVAEPDVKLEDIFSGSIPFLIMGIILLIIMIAFPAISTALPNLMMD